MARIVVVGSGASGVHFALTALQRGHHVTMVDVGFAAAEPPLPQATFAELKRDLEDPAEYFLGNDLSGVLFASDKKEYYGFPPGQQYIFRSPPDSDYTASGFNPLMSYARGGLAQAWTGGCYPFTDEDLTGFPISYEDLEQPYAEVAQRIGVTGVADDLARFLPVHDHLQAPLPLDRHSTKLMEAYERRRKTLNQRHRVFVGRTRVATLSSDIGERLACTRLGRCLWGCPTESLYTPAYTLRECLTFADFEYVPKHHAQFFRVDRQREVTHLVATSLETGENVELPLDSLVLAAGTLSSTKIFLRSVYERSGELPPLTGLMDNRQVLMPFLNLSMFGEQFEKESYVYHLLGLGIEMEEPSEYIHGQITTLTNALLHPIIQKLPFDVRTSTLITRSLHAALGVVNVNFSDWPRAENHVTLVRSSDSAQPHLAIEYHPPKAERHRLRKGIRKVKRALRALGCFVPPTMLHVRPMGASVHYAGTLPMTDTARPLTTNTEGRSHDFDNLFVVDGSWVPTLPSKNLTFTLMANAVRVAQTAF